MEHRNASGDTLIQEYLTLTLQVYAVEKSPEAAKWTQCNVDRYSLHSRVQVCSSRCLAYWPDAGCL